MKKVIVASTNPVKINAVLVGFQQMFPDEEFTVEGTSAPSGVSDQPRDNEETLRGALNRVDHISKNTDADFLVGLEGGIEEDGKNEMVAFGWAVVKSKVGKIGKGKTGTFYLPPQIVELLKQGRELGEVDDVVFGQKNSKQKNGTVGILTGNVIDRTKYFVSAVVFALIPFKNEEYYQ